MRCKSCCRATTISKCPLVAPGIRWPDPPMEQEMKPYRYGEGAGVARATKLDRVTIHQRAGARHHRVSYHVLQALEYLG